MSRVSLQKDPLIQFKLIFMGLVAVVGTILLAGMPPAHLCMEWQYQYAITDFKTWSDLFTFIKDLQTAIPPVAATVEIAWYLLTGDTWLFYKFAYILAGVGSYLLVIHFFAKNKIQLVLLSGISVAFLVVFRFLHKGNPQLYDVYTPFLFIIFTILLQKAKGTGFEIRWLLLAGTVLSIFELTRSFVFVMLPVMGVLVWVYCKGITWRQMAIFLLPMLLLSGGWHLKQRTLHGQWHWTNHMGFNLQKVWGDFLDEPPIEDLTPGAVRPDYPYINTAAHGEMSRVHAKKISSAVLSQPAKAVRRVGERMVAFYTPKTELYAAKLPAYVAWPFRLLFWGMSMLMFLLMGRWLLHAGQALLRRNWPTLSIASLIAIVAFMMAFLMAIGETGEDARFVLTVLPLLLAVLPEGLNVVLQKLPRLTSS